MRRKKITRTQKIYSFDATFKLVMNCMGNGAKLATIKNGLAFGLSVIYGKDYTMVVNEKNVAMGHTIRKYSVCPKKYMAYCC